MRQAQLQDDFCADLIHFLEDGKLIGETKEQRERLVFDSRLYLMADGMLMRNDGLSVEMRLVVPSQERQTLLKEAHNLPTAGHGGPRKTYARLVTRFFWPGSGNKPKNIAILVFLALCAAVIMLGTRCP